jgi:hypothetical protein
MDSSERVAEEAWVHRLGPEAETLFATGREPEPLVRTDVVDPIVSLLRGGQNVALVDPFGVGKRSLALSLRRSEAWGEAAQSTLAFDEPERLAARPDLAARGVQKAVYVAVAVPVAPAHQRARRAPQPPRGRRPHGRARAGGGAHRDRTLELTAAPGAAARRRPATAAPETP